MLRAFARTTGAPTRVVDVTTRRGFAWLRISNIVPAYAVGTPSAYVLTRRHFATHAPLARWYERAVDKLRVRQCRD